jgi:hypothetical protein
MTRSREPRKSTDHLEVRGRLRRHPLRALADGFLAILPRSWEAAAAAVVVGGALVGATVGIYHFVQSEPVPFLEKVDRVCLDAANQYAQIAGHAPSAEQRRAAIAQDALQRFERLHAPTEDALSFDTLVADKAKIARLRAAVADALKAGKSTTRLRGQLAEAQSGIQFDVSELPLAVCGQLRPDLE